MDFGASFDLVVSYLTLIDMPDLAAAIARMAASLRPGGTLLIANLTSFNTAGQPEGWRRRRAALLDRPLSRRASDLAFLARHKDPELAPPLEPYMTLLLNQGLQLRLFTEPAPIGGEPEQIARHRRVPYFHIMEWQKPV